MQLFIVIGAPSSGGRASPRMMRSSAARASRRASSARKQANAFSCGLRRSICWRCASTTSKGESCLLATRCASSCAGAKLMEVVIAIESRCYQAGALARHVTIPPMRSLIAKIVVALALLYGLAVVGLAWAMHQSPDVFGRVMSHVPGPAMLVLPFETLWMRARGGTLRKGD